jgi:hypothetical protein
MRVRVVCACACVHTCGRERRKVKAEVWVRASGRAGACLRACVRDSMIARII